MSRRNVSTGGPWEAKIGYSRAVRVGQSVQVSGTTAMTGTGLVGKGDPYAQTIQALKTIEAALVEAGASIGDVVRTRITVNGGRCRASASSTRSNMAWRLAIAYSWAQCTAST